LSQTAFTHGLQSGDSAAPVLHGSWAQLVVVPPQPPAQYLSTALTHRLSQLVLQQNESFLQTSEAQLPHEALSGPPVLHTS
jgi:hypothetical protein